MDFDRIREAARGYEKDMTAFLRAIVRHPGESCGERAHAETIAAEMRKLGFDFNWSCCKGGHTGLLPAFEEKLLEEKGRYYQLYTGNKISV